MHVENYLTTAVATATSAAAAAVAAAATPNQLLLREHETMSGNNLQYVNLVNKQPAIFCFESIYRS